MKKSILLFVVSVILFSCNQEESVLLENSTRIVFKDSKELLDSYLDLLNKDLEEQIDWSKSNTIEPLLVSECKDSLMMDMPSAFQALFNKDMELQVSDSIIKYEMGNLLLTSVEGVELPSPKIYGYGVASSIVDESDP